MKPRARDIDRLIQSPPEDVRVYLVFGPDSGLVRERGRALCGQLVPDIEDPFAVSRLSDEDIKTDRAALADSMAALSMTGGGRLVRLRLSGDSPIAADWLKSFEAGEAPAEARLVIEAGDLKRGSRLRKLAEDGKRSAALPCYADDGRDLLALAEASFAEEGLTLLPDARALLTPVLEGDRQLARSEIDKLILYKGLASQRQDGADTIGREDVAAISASGAEAALDRVIDPALSGDIRAADRGYSQAMDAGLSAVGVLRALQRKIDQLDMVQAGGGDEMAARRAGVPAFGPPAELFRRQARIWSGRRLEFARALAFDAEREVKRSGSPVEAIVGELVLRIARGAQSGGA